MRSIPMLTGVITIALLGVVSAVLYSEGAWLIGSLAAGFGVLRLVVFVLQLRRIWLSRADEASDAPEDAEPPAAP